jgi:hypothetical protein
VIVSTPDTQHNLPTESNLPSGDVSPTAVGLALGAGEASTQTVSVTLPASVPEQGYADVVFLVDESFAMEQIPTQSGLPSKQAWIGDAAREIDAALQDRGIVSNRFGLVGLRGPGDISELPLDLFPVRELGTVDYYSIITGGIGTTADSIATGDLDGDRDVDFVTATGAVMLVFLNEGDGHFAPGVPYHPTVPGFLSLALADFNGDDVLDVAASTDAGAQTEGSLSILLGRGDGTFEPSTSVSLPAPAGPRVGYQIEVADLNKDGFSDVVVPLEELDTTSVDELRIFLGQRDGQLSAPIVHHLGQADTNIHPDSVSSGDFDGDGNLDLVLTSHSSSDPVVSILFGNGDVTFGGLTHYPIVSNPDGPNFAMVTVADV